MLLAALLLVSAPQEIAITDALVLPSVGRYGRDPVPVDMVQFAIAEGSWKTPKEGDSLRAPDGSLKRWTLAKANADGAFTGRELNGGYVCAKVDLPDERIMVLEASGHGMVYVNGEPRGGDVYGYGYVKLPVRLKKGGNELLFHVSRGRLTAKLARVRSSAQFNAGDTTLPDIVKGWSGLGSIVVLNNSERPVNDLEIVSRLDGRQRTAKVSIGPRTCRKVGFVMAQQAKPTGSVAKVHLTLKRGDRILDETDLELRVRGSGETFKTTFVSEIDGSVQYYAVRPGSGNERHVVLSLHGASVEAIGQADAYGPSRSMRIVCPTNRRPYGFDWEDWGRLDALEVLRRENPSGTRGLQFLTGHSMGGHGTWHLSVTHPGLFEAIGPSAGWISFWSYAGGRRYADPDPIEKMLMRAASPSDTLALAQNLSRTPVYILHGDRDDNVPVTEARAMRDHLKPFHEDVRYHEQLGAGHWWDVSPQPGADCVDWDPMFQMFGEVASRSGEGQREIEFRTFDPGISNRYEWATIEQQVKPRELSSFKLRYDDRTDRVAGTTTNVARLHLYPVPVDLPRRRREIKVSIDGQHMKALLHTSILEKDRILPVIEFERVNGRWRQVVGMEGEQKSDWSTGPFKNAFSRHMVFVYGTIGTNAENAWSYAKARFDAETFWYRGNGSVDLVPDTAFDPHAMENRPDAIVYQRNAIIYGNAESNKAWGLVLRESPIQVRRGWVRVGKRTFRGNDLTCLFVRRYKSALIGAVSATGPAGMRTAERLPYFSSGVHYPDWIVLGTDALRLGSKGVRAAGFFGNDWKFSPQDSAWR